LKPKDFKGWLDSEYQNVESLQKLLLPYVAKLTEEFPVSIVAVALAASARETSPRSK